MCPTARATLRWEAVILRTEHAHQRAAEHMVELQKQVIMTTTGPVPLGLVRKRLPTGAAHSPPVLLLHGFGQNRYTWHTSQRSFSAYLAHLGFDVYNMELRGHGRSRRFSDSWTSELSDYIEADVPACTREVMRLSGSSKVFLVGHSMGGLIAYRVAERDATESIAGVVTLGSPYQFGLGSPLLGGVGRLLRYLGRSGQLRRAPRVPLKVVGRHLRKRRALWDHPYFPSPIKVWRPGSIEDSVLEEYLRLAFDWTSLPVAGHVACGAMPEFIASSGEGTHEDHASGVLALPLLVLAGKRDSLAPPASVEPAFRASSSVDKAFHVFDMGHIDLIVGREAPEKTWRVIGDWLSARAAGKDE